MHKQTHTEQPPTISKLLFTAILSTLIASACSTSTSPKVAQKASPTAAEELLDVYVLGSTSNPIYGNGNAPDPLLNPKTQVPPFREDDGISENCKPGAIKDASSIGNRQFLNIETYNSVMQQGLEAAKRRYAWNFHSSRAKAQKEKMDSTTKRLGPQGMDRLRMQREIYLKEAHLPLDKRSMAAKLNSPEFNQMVTLPEMQQRLAHNFSVLSKREVSIKESEREYTMQMILLYEEAFKELRALAPSNSMALLNKYEIIRQNHLAICLKRSSPGEAEQLQISAIDNQVRLVSRSIILANRIAISNRMSKADLIADKKRIYDELFSTRLLKNIAQAELGIPSPDGSKLRDPSQGLTIN